MSKVSIIIPVYNADKYLVAALDSALQQTLGDIEIVCIDDGSTDSSAEILAEYQKKDKRVKVFTQPNSGGSAARNAGLDKATGDYVMFLDADDLYAKDIVAHAYSRAVDTEADIVFYNFARFVGRPSKLALVNKYSPSTDITFFTKDSYTDRFFNDFAIITWNKLIKKSVIINNQLSFNTDLSHNHDVDFSIRLMLAASSFSWLHRVGYYYRTNEWGLTATKRSDPTNILKILLDLNEKVAKYHPHLKPSFNNYVVAMIDGTITKYRDDSDKVRAIAQFSHDVIIPRLGLEEGNTGSKGSSGIFNMIQAGEYEKIGSYLHHPKQEIRVHIRKMYDVAQSVLTRFTV